MTTQAKDVLVSHAYKNVWSTVDPYRQAIYRAARITPPAGEWRYVELYWNELPLPNDLDRFHIYQLGYYHNTLTQLSSGYRGKWIALTDVCEQTNVMIDGYNSSGVQLPRHNCWVYITADSTLLIAAAIPAQDVIAGLDLDRDIIDFRFYSNNVVSKYQSQAKVLAMGGARVKSAQEINALSAKALQALNAYGSGDVVFTINGRYCDVLNLVTAKIGDYVDWMFTASIEKIIDFKVSELKPFRSTLDNEVKQLISHNEPVNIIEHHDDISVYVITKSVSSTKGVLVHKSNESGIRMVTHRDYSISERALAAILAANGIARNQAYVRFVYHNNPRTRALVYENNRIHELYKLPFAKRYALMNGTSNGPAMWTAAQLEQSKYRSLMSARSGQITRDMVVDAYGYNSLSTILGGTPSKVVHKATEHYVDIPVGLQMICTGYEYDAQGKLCGVGVSRNSTVYNCTNPKAQWVELIFGEGDNSVDYIFDSTTGSYKDAYNYRFYQKSGNDWQDVTGSNKYTARNGVWTLAQGVDPGSFVAVSNARHIFGSRQVEIVQGVIEFTITARVNRVDIPITIPTGQVDVFLNEHPLVEGVDFFISWPQVVITNTEYIRGNVQNVNWRCFGFCDPESMQHEPVQDYGFVINGKLSGNARYDIHDDRVLSIICAGAMYDRSEVVFAETTSQVSVADAREGFPYAIKDIVVPMNNYLVATGAPNDSTDRLRVKAQEIDQRVINYMTANFPQQDLGIAQLGEKVYRIYSPFFSRIISDLYTGLLNDPAIERGNYTESGLRRLVQQYLPLLDTDPIVAGSDKTRECAIIVPHCYSGALVLNTSQKNFLDDVVDLYGQGLINLDGYVSVN